MSAKVVLVTGCSKGGIGFYLCEEFAKQGCTVYATARKVEKMEGFVHPSIHKLELDVVDDKSIKLVMDHVIEREGKIDVLVNNAGVPAFGPALEVPLDEVKAAFDANVFSILRVSRAVLPHMAARKQGLILNVGSVVGEIPTPWSGIYSASKAAAHSVTQSMWMECKPFNVKVMLVAPGGVTSNFVASYGPQYNLAPDSLYTTYLPHIIRRMWSSQTPQSMRTDVFAQKVVKQALASSPPFYFSAGNNATMFGFAKWLPRTWMLRYLWGMFSGPVKSKSS